MEPRMETVGEEEGYILCPLEQDKDESSISFRSREKMIRIVEELCPFWRRHGGMPLRDESTKID